MARRRLRLVLKWIGGFIAWYVYGFLVFAILGSFHGDRFLLAISVWIAPLIVLLAFWVYVESPAELKRRAGMQFKAMLRR
jgi:hypothetical protein